jgi:hypothetical protein
MRDRQKFLDLARVLVANNPDRAAEVIAYLIDLATRPAPARTCSVGSVLDDGYRITSPDFLITEEQ